MEYLILQVIENNIGVLDPGVSVHFISLQILKDFHLQYMLDPVRSRPA